MVGYNNQKELIEKKRKIFNMSTGEQIRDYLCIKELCKLILVLVNNPNIGWTTTGSPYYGNLFTTTSTSSTNMLYNNTSLTSGTISTNSFLNNLDKPKKSTRQLETGRVEKGSNSDQSFTYDNSSFYTFPFQTNWWKLKPQSTKPLVAEDLVVYCTECGSKRKKDNHKFCPHCGTKF